MKKVLSMVARTFTVRRLKHKSYHPEVQSSKLKSKPAAHNGSYVQA